MEYQTSRDGGRLQRIAARLAKDPTVLASVKTSTMEIRSGRLTSSLRAREAFDLRGSMDPRLEEEQVDPHLEEEVGQTATA